MYVQLWQFPYAVITSSQCCILVCTSSRVRRSHRTHNTVKKKMHIQLICGASLIGDGVSVKCGHTSTHTLKEYAKLNKTHSKPRCTLTKPCANKSKRKLLVPNCMSAGERQWIAMTAAAAADCGAFPRRVRAACRGRATLPHRREGAQLLRGEKTRGVGFTLPFQLRLWVCVGCWPLNAD